MYGCPACGKELFIFHTVVCIRIMHKNLISCCAHVFFADEEILPIPYSPTSYDTCMHGVFPSYLYLPATSDIMMMYPCRVSVRDQRRGGAIQGFQDHFWPELLDNRTDTRESTGIPYWAYTERKYLSMFSGGMCSEFHCQTVCMPSWWGNSTHTCTCTYLHA